MPKIYSMMAKGYIDVPDKRPVKAGPEVVIDGDALKAAVQCNGYLLDSLKEVTAKLEAATAALARAEARAVAAEGKHEAMERAGSTESSKAIAGISTSIGTLQAAVGRLAADVAVIRDKPAPAAPVVQAAPAKPVVVPAPVVDMAAITSVIRAEMAKHDPASRGALDTEVVERDANGYVKRFITKPLNH